jgi:hypothetical protein
MSEAKTNPGCFKCKYLAKAGFDSSHRYIHPCKHESNLKVVKRPLKDVVIRMQDAEEKNRFRRCPYFEYNFLERVKLFFKRRSK